MAKGMKTGGRDFKKGQPGGPGRPRVLPAELVQDLVEFRKLNTFEFMKTAQRYIFTDVTSLKKAMGDDSLPALDRIMIGMIIQCATYGNVKRTEILMSRLLGPISKQSVSPAIDVPLTAVNRLI